MRYRNMSAPQSTLSRLITGTFSTGIGRLVTIVFGLLCTIIYTRWLPKEEYGSFVLLQLTIYLVISLSGFGIETSLTKFLASSNEENSKHQIINTAVYFRIITAIIASTILIVGRELFYKEAQSSLYIELLMYLPALVIIEAIGNLFSEVFMGTMKFVLFGVMDIIYSFASFFLTIILVIWFHQGVVGLVYARLIPKTLAMLFAFFHLRQYFRIRFDFILLKKLLRFGFPLYINNILNFFFSKADTFLIGMFLGTADVALYEIARKIPESLEMLYNAFRVVFFPIITNIFASGKSDHFTKVLNDANRLLTFVGVFSALLAFLFRKEIITIIFSERYLPCAPAFALLMFAFTLIVLDSNLGFSLVAIGDPDKSPIINIIRTIICFTGYLIIIPVFGVVGAVMANLIGVLLVNPLNVYFLRRRNISVKFSVYLKPIFLYGLLISLILGLDPQCFHPKIAILGLYVLGSIFLSVINQEDVALIVNESRIILASILRSYHSKSV